jgi:hypothetical protein
LPARFKESEMSTRRKVVLVGALVLATVAVFLVYRAFASPLSSKRISIVMHDPETVQPESTGKEDLLLKCSIRLPKECTSVPVQGVCIVAKSKAMLIDISMRLRESVGNFRTFVAEERKSMLQHVNKLRMDEEGVTTIDGLNAYVMTYHFVGDTDVPCIGRRVYVETAKADYYVIWFRCIEADWDAKHDIIDSSISTFHFSGGQP